jgi:hypothetical protein
MSAMDRALGAELPKIGAIAFTALYVVGFLVVTLHLQKFGVTPVTWLRPQYLLAGTWCLLPLVLFAGVVGLTGLEYVELRCPRSSKRQSSSRRGVRYAWGEISLFAGAG